MRSGFATQHHRVFPDMIFDITLTFSVTSQFLQVYLLSLTKIAEVNKKCFKISSFHRFHIFRT